MAKRSRAKMAAGQKTRKVAVSTLGVIAVLIVDMIFWPGQVRPNNFIVQSSGISPVVAASDTLKEEQLWQMIRKNEAAFFEFEARVRVASDSLEAGFFKENLFIPFQLVRNNAEGNKYRNWLALMRNRSTLEDSSGRMNITTADFYYAFLSSETQATWGVSSTIWATYTAPNRLMSINPVVNTLNLLGFYHEVFHVGQDNFIRGELTSAADMDKYISWHYQMGERDKKMRLKFGDELTAIGMELELANLLAGGYLRDTVSSGKKPDPRILARRLNIVNPNKPDELCLTFYSHIAQFFFPEGLQLGKFRKPYILALADIYVRNGNRIFLLSMLKGPVFQEVSIKDLEKLPELVPFTQ